MGEELKALIFEKYRSANIWSHLCLFGNKLLTNYLEDAAVHNQSIREKKTDNQHDNDKIARINENSEKIKMSSFKWKTGVILILLDSLLSEKHIPDVKKKRQMIAKLYDNLTKCVEVENKDVRKRIMLVFQQYIKPLVAQWDETLEW
ncbi:hypothetical protein RFI_11416 [Reticulomyxa filosa]|uniref:Uncharacterized protein n=1 Tax=Reticulomyxa filosa TaxID=46433 RepID=X6NIA0_RETFI|nr:hypothetical protein RFI_11416 [Reticulomyxa filosa]|eukprot:ETO25721.1 hypothetical protein RFI_11416 [Reticulomyxa filosa]